jgi:hypothetical protein
LLPPPPLRRPRHPRPRRARAARVGRRRRWLHPLVLVIAVVLLLPDTIVVRGVGDDSLGLPHVVGQEQPVPCQRFARGAAAEAVQAPASPLGPAAAAAVAIADRLRAAARGLPAFLAGTAGRGGPRRIIAGGGGGGGAEDGDGDGDGESAVAGGECGGRPPPPLVRGAGHLVRARHGGCRRAD